MSLHFAHPAVLWGLLLLPLLAWYEIQWGLGAKARFRFSWLGLAGRPDPGPRRDSLLILTGLRLAALALVLLALARPQKGRHGEDVLTPATDILLCLDTSTSMEALDFKPKNRLDAAKDVIQDFIRHRRHDRIGLVVFSGLAFTQCPLTVDYGALAGFLDHARTGMIQEDGTAIGTAILTSVARLKDSAAKSKVIILLTDGRNNRGEVDPVTAAKTAAAFGIKIYAVGTGAVGGSLYRVEDPIFGTREVRLPEDLDEPTLREVAGVTQGKYFRATDWKSLRQIYKDIDAMEKTDVQVRTFTDFQDAYLPLVAAALCLLMTEVALAQTLLRRVP
jgi:Ca-activated chloride channel homolog